MGFRFRKSITLAKGVRVNFSKRGVGLSVGKRGASVSVGPRGTWANVGIPGTGLSYGARLDKPKSSKKTASSVTNTYRNGQRSAPSRAEKAALRESALADLREESELRAAEINSVTEGFIGIIKLAPKVVTVQDFAAAIEIDPPFFYQKEEFPYAEPVLQDFVAYADELAKQEIKGIFKGKERDAFARNMATNLLSERHALWVRDKGAFDCEQTRREQEARAIFEEELERERDSMRRLLRGERDAMESAIDEWLQSLELPIETAVSFEILDSTVFVDLDLPEIEDVPMQEAVVMANGSLKIKERTQKSARECYAQCIFGLAAFVSANILNLAPTASRIVLSAFTQRRDKRGEIFDDYILSVKFMREAFEEKDLSRVSPEKFFLSFENRCLVSKTKVFKSVVPYGMDD